ncbi:DUF1236 domain-containing protein [Mesorhizobium sp. A556]
MKTHLCIATAVLLLAGGGVAAAQDTIIVPADTVIVPAEPAPAPRTVVIQPEQQTVIREYVHKNPAASINILGLELSLGAKVPDTVELREVPNVPYRYAVINDQTVLIDPETHEIVDVLN